MINVFLCSDLHSNFHRDAGKSMISGCYTKDVDVAVVAGDLSIFSHLDMNIKMFCDKYPNVVYVTGNHEYYHSTFERIDEIVRELELKIANFHFLNNDRVVIDGQPFIGGTLWFPRSTAAGMYKHMLNDFACIPSCDPIAYERYEETVEFFENNMEENDIVVTHHLPTYKSVDQRYATSPLNCYFACDLDDMIKDKKPSHWLHGHTHHNCDYLHHSTHIAANPFGYPGENHFYDDSFIFRT